MFLLYAATLDRAPDATGHRSWVEILSEGQKSLIEVANGFVGSAEFQRNYGDVSNRDFITLLYNNVLDRTPDRDGLEYWTARLAQGTTVAEAAGGFSGSREFKNTYGTLNDDGFVRLMYRNVLERDADASGLDYWKDALAQGAGRGDVLAGFSQSREFTARTAPELYNWMVAQGTDDVLQGGSGRNVLFGGMWSDTFVFNAAPRGVHEVADLESWDQLRFEGFGYDTVAEIRVHLRQDGDDVIFADQGVELRMVNVDIAMLANDSLFDV